MDASAEAVQTATQHKGTVMPISKAAPTLEKVALTADMRVGAKEGSKGRGVVGGLQAVAWEGPTVVRVELQAWAACGHHSRDLGWEGVAVITPVCCSSNHCVHMGPTLVQFTCDHL